MRTRLIVVHGISGKNAPQVRLTEDDHMIQALASQRADQTFSDTILPWRSGRDRPVADAHRRDATGKDVPMGPVIIPPPNRQGADAQGNASVICRASHSAVGRRVLLLQRTNQYAEATDYWRRYLASDCQSEWAARARRSLKFCEMQINLIASA
jgi:hypothetical protein